MGNRERILEASLALFNERGTASVTTNHIAADLSISPGNLYYHFRNKEEIIRTIFPLFAESVKRALSLPPDRALTSSDVGRYHRAGVEVLWRYRFLTRDPQELVDRDPSLAEPMQALNEWLTSWFVAIFERLIADGRMRRPSPPEDLARIATNAVMLWSSWLGFSKGSKRGADVARDDVAEGALQSFLTFAPYLEEGFAAEVRAALGERPQPAVDSRASESA